MSRQVASAWHFYYVGAWGPRDGLPDPCPERLFSYGVYQIRFKSNSGIWSHGQYVYIIICANNYRIIIYIYYMRISSYIKISILKPKHSMLSFERCFILMRKAILYIIHRWYINYVYSIYLSIHPSIHLSIYLSIYLSLYIYIIYICVCDMSLYFIYHIALAGYAVCHAAALSRRSAPFSSRTSSAWLSPWWLSLAWAICEVPPVPEEKVGTNEAAQKL